MKLDAPADVVFLKRMMLGLVMGTLLCGCALVGTVANQFNRSTGDYVITSATEFSYPGTDRAIVTLQGQ